MSVGEWALVVIAVVYAGFALFGIVALLVGLKLYGNLKRSIEGLKKEIDPYKAQVDDLMYKVQQIMDIATEIMGDLKSVSEKTKDTVSDVMDKTSRTADEVFDLVLNTKKRVEVHTGYLFERIEEIEERLDNIYAVLKGAGVLVSKLKITKEGE